MRYKITRQQYLWFTLTATADRIMYDLRPLVKSKEKYEEIETELWDIVEKKQKVIGYRRHRRAREFVKPKPQKTQRELCKIL